ncbi:MAG TPA: glycosyltransferase [Candidatus Margulisbacteria bacterium]|nr:MAG: hypothetical protein A2X41_06430 [Candidatus Margulisbacteria bacterium GWE2_39_32]HCT85110.1 glycosyltransferase [Candidatus Margulisiibacteriota bacterium]
MVETKYISVIIPVFNEQENLIAINTELLEVLNKLPYSYEIIYVNDGSTDNSISLLSNISKNHNRIRVISFNRNYGQTAALSAGFEEAEGQYIVTLDADRQNSPKDIPALFKYIPKYDIVCGIRKHRKDSLVKIISSKIANSIRNIITNENITDTGCSLKIIKKEYAKSFPLFEGMHRFFPTLVKLKGGKSIEVEVSHNPRRFGKSKYTTLNRMFIAFIDCLAVKWMQKRTIRYKVINNE